MEDFDTDDSIKDATEDADNALRLLYGKAAGALKLWTRRPDISHARRTELLQWITDLAFDGIGQIERHQPLAIGAGSSAQDADSNQLLAALGQIASDQGSAPEQVTKFFVALAHHFVGISAGDSKSLSIALGRVAEGRDDLALSTSKVGQLVVEEKVTVLERKLRDATEEVTRLTALAPPTPPDVATITAERDAALTERDALKAALSDINTHMGKILGSKLTDRVTLTVKDLKDNTKQLLAANKPATT